MYHLRNLAVGAALAVASAGAFSNDVNNVVIVPAGGSTFYGALHTDAFDFTDVFTFTNVTGLTAAQISLVTIGSGANNIDFVSADLNGNALTLSPNGLVETGFIDFAAFTEPLVLTVTGKSGASGGTFASYSGTINVIPEPQIWAMLLAGIVGIGFIARRRLDV
jgi:PEP-CTERM motif-containing protein